VIEFAGLILVTDPTFDPPRSFQRPGGAVVSKLVGPAVSPEEIGSIDAVLLSHDEHPDNLDQAGRAYLDSAPVVFTTTPAARRLGGTARGLDPWQTATLDAPGGATVTITAVPAQHGPTPDAWRSAGPVIGFLLDDGEGHRVYVSGDNASVDVVREIVSRLGVPDVSVLFVGGASVPFLFDGDFVTLNAVTAVAAAGVLSGSAIIPAHLTGWSHFTDTEAGLATAFAEAGLASHLHLLHPGETYHW
jgi:L-ascorbate metabolism protein UlaG (beta-lactamase superfamily)